MRLRAAAAALCVAAVAACSPTPQQSKPGPIAGVAVTSWSPTVRVGQQWTDGWSSLTLRGTRPAVIDAIRLLPGSNGAGLRLVGAKVADQRRRSTFQFDESWPPTAPQVPPALMKPALHADLAPGHSYELLLGLEATKPGYLVRQGIEVRYHVGDQHYVRVLTSWMGVCTSKTLWKKNEAGGLNCPTPAGFPG